jgi:D-lactate dehydrogenase
MKIAFFDTKPYDRPSFEKHARAAGVTIKFYETKLSADTVELAAGADAVCVFVNDTVDAAVIDRLSSLGVRLLALRCAGFNNVDMKHAFGRIHVFRVPAYSPYAVAEHAMALLLTSVRRIHKAYIRSRDFNFSLAGLTGFDLHGKTVGVVGTGRIGRVFIDICRGFGMKVLAFDKFPNPDVADGERVRYVAMDELLKESDIISLHCPLTDETYHLINRDTIALIKAGCILVNTSRGALINTEHLIEGIREHRFFGVGLDVYEEEDENVFENREDDILRSSVTARLLSFPNVIVTSHQGFLTHEALDAIARTTLDNAMSVARRAPIESNLVGAARV